MNVTGIEQGQGPLSLVANSLSTASKPSTLVHRPQDQDDEKRPQESLKTSLAEVQQDRVEISSAARALSKGEFQFSPQDQESSSPFNRE